MNLDLVAEHEQILAADGHVLVVGGPGSGKTTIALEKATRRIQQGLLHGQSILFLSFSRAAVARLLAASERVPRALRPNLAIQTFHSFFWSVVQAQGYLLGALRTLRLLPPHDEKALRRGADDDADADWRAERERLFREEGLVAFDLFAEKAAAILSGCVRLRTILSSRHPLIVVDEAQDTGVDQWHSMELLAERSQVICLADLDQQIYDFRPDVSAQRIEDIAEALHPLRVDLGARNHRSPDSEIVRFGDDILNGTPRGAAYSGVSQLRFVPRRGTRDTAIRSSVGIVAARIKQQTGRGPETIAVLATWGRGVSIVSRALTGDPPSRPIHHRVLIDEAPVLLSARLVAFLLEPRRDNELRDLADGLELAAAVFRARGGKTSLSQADRLSAAASDARRGAGKPLRAGGTAGKLLTLLGELKLHLFRGDPRKDWIETRMKLRAAGGAPLVDVADCAEQLAAFQQGHQIADGLSDLWQKTGTYQGARNTLDTALSQYHLLGGEEASAIQVMTIHKAKGKEFDGVVILHERNCSPLNYCREEPPHRRSRRLLRVGVTRAKYHVVILRDALNDPEILDGHKL